MTARGETSRVEAFSDGVIAIAATLLILEVKVPAHANVHSAADLWQALWHLWPSYFAFVYSFGTILVAWLNHHAAFKNINGLTTRFMYANGLLLMSVTVLPFPTALLADYLTTEYAQPAIAFFCACAALHNLGWIALVEAMGPKSGILKPDAVEGYAVTRRATYFGGAIYLTTTILAFWFPIPALTINALVWFLWIAMAFVAR